MDKANIGLVCVASHAESGGERFEAIQNAALSAFDKKKLQVVTASKLVWDVADALSVVDELKAAQPKLLVIVHLSWVCDTIQYALVNSLKCPVVLWALPFAETFSLACVQHFGSVLRHNDMHYSSVYGLPEADDIVDTIAGLAATATLVEEIKNSRIALIGPRQTWRVASSQDMVKEEWDFSRTFGTTLIHLEMDELTDAAHAHTDPEADKILEEMSGSGRLGTSRTSQERLRTAAKTYLAVKELFVRYGLSAATAECYPRFSGLVNLPSSWLADEQIVLDTEGDIGHTFLMYAMSRMGSATPPALAEVGEIESSRNSVVLVHEGSSAHSLAGDISKVLIQDGGEGTMVGFPFAGQKEVTVSQLVGTDGKYRVLIAKALTEEISSDDWQECGSKLMIRLKFSDGKEFIDQMFAQGLDHHLLIKVGDITSQLSELCRMLDVETVRL